MLILSFINNEHSGRVAKMYISFCECLENNIRMLKKIEEDRFLFYNRFLCLFTDRNSMLHEVDNTVNR